MVCYWSIITTLFFWRSFHVLVARLQDAFKTLFPKESMDNVAAPPFLYVAITSSDSSIVYYKLSQGIVKPPVWCRFDFKRTQGHDCWILLIFALDGIGPGYSPVTYLILAVISFFTESTLPRVTNTHGFIPTRVKEKFMIVVFEPWALTMRGSTEVARFQAAHTS